VLLTRPEDIRPRPRLNNTGLLDANRVCGVKKSKKPNLLFCGFDW